MARSRRSIRSCTPVRNIAMPVLRAPFNVYEFGD
jgi:hypothetical protein